MRMRMPGLRDEIARQGAGEVQGSNLSDAARRALAEAEQRLRQAGSSPAPAREVKGRDGPDPVRYGDWEVKGIASDF